MNKPTFFDVCSGIGMGSLAAETAGFDVLGHCEIHPFCQAVLRKHWPEVPIFDDLRKLTANTLRERGIDRVDLFAGWIPCQPASIAGQRKGEDDDRWLWDEFMRLVRELRPMWLLAENPTGLLSLKDDGFERICNRLEAAGYEVQAYVFGAWSVGAPQRRDRVFIVGRLLSDSVRERRQQVAGSAPRNESANEGWPTFTDNESQRPIEDMGNTFGVRLQRQPRGRSDNLVADTNESDEPLADADSAERRSFAETGHGWADGYRCGREQAPSGFTGGRQKLGNATGQPEREPHDENGSVAPKRNSWTMFGGRGYCQLGNTDNPGQQEQRIAVSATTGQSELRSGRQFEPGVGGVTSRSTWRLDRPLWPAGRGAEQFEYEPPRLAQGTAYRQERLMALGNMVVPECILPIFEFVYDQLTPA